MGGVYAVTRLDDEDGLIKANTLDLAMGLDFTPVTGMRFNVQMFNKTLSRHDSSMAMSRRRNGRKCLSDL